MRSCEKGYDGSLCVLAKLKGRVKWAVKLKRREEGGKMDGNERMFTNERLNGDIDQCEIEREIERERNVREVHWGGSPLVKLFDL